MSQTATSPRAAQMQFIAPTFMTADAARAIDFYTTKLGFPLLGDHPGLKIFERAEARIHFIITDAQPVPTNHVRGCCIYVDDIDALHEEFMQRGAPLNGPPITRPWGYRDFTVVDPDGYELLFAQHVGDD